MTETADKPAIAAAIVVDGGRVLMVRRRVKEGELSWQFPAGAVERDEDPDAAAERETEEETGAKVKAAKRLGERVHPKTGRLMYYTACELISGEAHVADDEELDAVAWVAHSEITDYVPYPLFDQVQAYLDEALPRS